MIVHHAAWLLPIAQPPIRNGWVAVDEERIVSLGGPRDPPPPGVSSRFESAAILPGLINTHTHLELSWMAGLVPPMRSMGEWLRQLMALRRGAVPSGAAQTASAAAALLAAKAGGTVAFGDISNTLLTAPLLAETRTTSVLFHELVGFAPHDAVRRAADGARRVMASVQPPVVAGLGPHAPYSVSPDLFRAVAREVATRGLRSSVHVAESRDELEFLISGRGGIAGTLEALGVRNDDWRPPGLDPVAYLDTLGVLQPGLLTVHATELGASALARLAACGCVIVACPRSNRWVGGGDPPLDAFYASGSVVALGTDSLASAPDLDMFAELAAARAVSTVPAAALLESATRGGAVALGFDRELGTIEPGKRAALLAVEVPDGTTDVEQYLVQGISPARVRWLAAG